MTQEETAADPCAGSKHQWLKFLDALPRFPRKKIQETGFKFQNFFPRFPRLFCTRFRDKIVSMEFMRKYVHVARNIRPALTKEACEHVAEEYARLRAQEGLDQNNVAKVTEAWARRDGN